jgi:sugar O-acyltransferase (sialic acid O-acetyltransferase NeuD family)
MDVFIFGAGGFAKEVMLLCEDCGYKVIGFIDFNNGVLCDKPIFTEDIITNIKKDAVYFVIGIGDSNIRKKIYNKYKKLNWINVIHPSVNFNYRYNNIGIGNVICKNSIITVDTIIGDFNQINLSCTIGHDTKIGSYNTLSPDVNISGNVNIGDNCYFGTNSVVIEKINIKNDIVIGASGCVVKDVLAAGTYVGIPCKKIK